MKWKDQLDNYTFNIPAHLQQETPFILPEQATFIDITIGQHASIVIQHAQRTSTQITITLEPYAQLSFSQWLAQENAYQTTIMGYQNHNSTLIFNGIYDYSIDATLTFYLHGQHSQATVICMLDAHNTTQHNFTTFQMHQAPYTTSSFLLKGLLQDKTRSTHQGMIHIDAQAHHTNATLNSRYLLIGNYAQAYTQPQLEVLNNDVECSHGSAIGSCDDNDLFYLATRGLNKKHAQKLICNAFFKNRKASIT